jgi:signal transduction histidine kinase
MNCATRLRRYAMPWRCCSRARPALICSASLTSIIDHQVSHLTRVVDDLLDVSRIVRGHIYIERAPVEVATLVARAVEIASPLIHQRSQILQITPCDAPLVVEGDLVRLTQVLSNLLDNAAKFTPEDGQIWLGVRGQAGEVQPSVQDTGYGIAAERLEQLFDFFAPSAQAALQGGAGGLGLGGWDWYGASWSCMAGVCRRIARARARAPAAS